VKSKCFHCSKKYDSKELNKIKELRKYTELCRDCREKILEFDNRIKTMSLEEVRQEIENRFKNMETYEDLEELFFFTKNSFEILSFEIRSRRGHKPAFHFTQNRYNPNRADYLYDDGVSEGSCRVKNMNRYLEIKVYKQYQ